MSDKNKLWTGIVSSVSSSYKDLRGLNMRSQIQANKTVLGGN
ncbi:hypothetical protein [Cylindrospermum sp. FACHB-282]|nr:hypothetical protein [Cylindrospermum sp. FACHB-282]